MATTVSGLASGLDTTSIVNSLMAIEANQQTLLKQQSATTTSTVNLLTQLNTRLTATQTAASALSTPSGLVKTTISSSDPSVTATAGTGAAAGSISMTVDALATRQTSITAAMSSWAGGDLTFTSSTGTATTVALNGATSLDSVVNAVNSSSAGVRAAKVYAGTSTDGTVQYKLQFSSRDTGAAGAFTAQNANGDLATTNASTAADAQITLWPGTSAATAVHNASNTFSSLLPGVDVTISTPSTTPVTLNVTEDTATQASDAAALFTSVTAALNYISTNSAVTASSTNGTSSTSAGALNGDATVRDIQRALLTAVQSPINGVSPSSIGVSIDQTGAITFDQAKYQSALQADPAGTRAAFATIAGRVKDATTAAVDSSSGTLTREITSDNSRIKSLATQISDWDGRLAAKKASLTKVYANLETQLSQLQAQSNWLTSQLSSLSSSTTSSSSSSSLSSGKLSSN